MHYLQHRAVNSRVLGRVNTQNAKASLVALNHSH